MTVLERFIERCHSPHDDRGDNCAHAVAAALQDFAKARQAFTLARSVYHELSVTESAETAAYHAQCRQAHPETLQTGFGVAETSQGPAIVLRTENAWWQRGKTGAVKVPARRVLVAWSVE